MPTRISFGALPWATLFAVLLTLVLGVTSVADTDELSFDQFTTAVIAVWSFLAVGRGLAAKEQDIDTTPFISFVNSFPWATVVVAIVAVIGYLGVVVFDTDSMTIGELGIKLGVLVGALGLGRGLGTYKKDTTFRAPMLAGDGEPFDEDEEITDDNLASMAAKRGLTLTPVAESSGGGVSSRKVTAGQDDEPEPPPVKGPPQGI